jgi:hypothetical protein
MRFEYAILAFKKWYFDRVTLPDGTVREVRRNKGMALVESWFERHIAPNSYELAAEAHRQWEARFQAWRAGVEVKRDEVLNAELSTRFKRVVDEVEIVWLPNGTNRTVPAGRSEQLLLAHYADNVEPEPGTGELTFEAWLRTAELSVETGLRGWKGTMQIDDVIETIGESCTSWSSVSVPESALPILNALGQDGWEVISVNEDKGLYSGEDAQAESGSSAIRYLLKRAQPADGPTLPPTYSPSGESVRVG